MSDSLQPTDRFTVYEVLARILTLHSSECLATLLAELAGAEAAQRAEARGRGEELRLWSLSIEAELDSRADPAPDPA